MITELAQPTVIYENKRPELLVYKAEIKKYHRKKKAFKTEQIALVFFSQFGKKILNNNGKLSRSINKIMKISPYEFTLETKNIN